MRLMMTPVWTKPLASNLFDEMDRFFDSVSGSEPQIQSLSPAFDVSESEGHYLVSVDVPGMSKDALKIELKENVLTISGERKFEKSNDDKNQYFRRERSYGSFERRFTLPEAVDAAKVEAHYENGVLDIYIPKAEAAKPRTIEIRSGQKGGGFFDRLLGEKKQERELKDVKSTQVS